MPCNHDDLIRFVRSELQVEELERVLQHLHRCSDCSGLMDTLVRLRANRRQIAETLYDQASAGSADWKNWLRAPIRLTLAIPAPQRLAGAVMVLLALVSAPIYFWVQPRPANLANLAVQEPYPYQPMVFRSDPNPPAETFHSAIRHYEQNDLGQARSLLESYVRRNPSDADAHFYLGVVNYLMGDFREALRSLQEGLRVRTIQPEEKFHWYLAQVYLKLQSADRAREELNRVLTFRGEFNRRAESLLDQIR